MDTATLEKILAGDRYLSWEQGRILDLVLQDAGEREVGTLMSQWVEQSLRSRILDCNIQGLAQNILAMKMTDSLRWANEHNHKIGYVITQTREEILAIEGIGPKSLLELERMLASVGLCLKKTPRKGKNSKKQRLRRPQEATVEAEVPPVPPPPWQLSEESYTVLVDYDDPRWRTPPESSDRYSVEEAVWGVNQYDPFKKWDGRARAFVDVGRDRSSKQGRRIIVVKFLTFNPGVPDEDVANRIQELSVDGWLPFRAEMESLLEQHTFTNKNIVGFIRHPLETRGRNPWFLHRPSDGTLSLFCGWNLEWDAGVRFIVVHSSVPVGNDG